MEPRLVLNAVPATQGWAWIRLATRLFLKQPLGFWSLFGAFLLAALVSLFVPVLGSWVVLALVPYMGLAMMMGAALAVQEQGVSPRVYLLPLKATDARRLRLAWVCGLYAVLTMAVMLLSDGLDGGRLAALQSLMAQGQADEAQRRAVDEAMADPALHWGLMVRFGLTGLLAVPFWFAPALVWWGHQGVAQSLFSSTLALWRAKAAVAVFMLAWLGLISVGAWALSLVLQALGLGQVFSALLMPLAMTISVVFYLSVYFMFVSLFALKRTDGTDELKAGA